MERDETFTTERLQSIRGALTMGRTVPLSREHPVTGMQSGEVVRTPFLLIPAFRAGDSADIRSELASRVVTEFQRIRLSVRLLRGIFTADDSPAYLFRAFLQAGEFGEPHTAAGLLEIGTTIVQIYHINRFLYGDGEQVYTVTPDEACPQNVVCGYESFTPGVVEEAMRGIGDINLVGVVEATSYIGAIAMAHAGIR